MKRSEVRTDVDTTTEAGCEQHLSKEEIEKPAHPKRPARQRFGVVLSYVGMGLSCTASSRSTGWLSPHFEILRRSQHGVHPEPRRR